MVTSFKPELLRNLLDNVLAFKNNLYFGEELESEIESYDGKDISDCSGLSIYSKLKEISVWGENMNLVEFKEVKEVGKNGAIGIIGSWDDHIDLTDPIHFYEIGHIDQEEEKEYVKELALDEIVKELFNNDRSVSPAKGSEVYLNFITEAIERGKNYFEEYGLNPDQWKKRTKYSCLVQLPTVEVWKVGFDEMEKATRREEPCNSYQLLILGEKYCYCIGLEYAYQLLKQYLSGEKIDVEKNLPEIQLGWKGRLPPDAEIPMFGSGWNEDMYHWFSPGKIKFSELGR